ncbi:PepSY domain-containing protein [Ramlibacter sp. XY19]|uniref:PepSY domain-containing protein n=1 Tax=Ramlibacter paludis TaxID=2908000 RepID=UPI0023D9A7DB|nr:PepSY domain-containing protein [Ramlibacter paludis]MCG2592593.1 PepSY domain-containing protein [Ramlibacter paludis]
MKSLLTAIAALTLGASAFAHGEFKCDVPKAEWKPQMELKAKLETDGWKKVRQVKVENGCYEVYGFDEKNERAEKFYNPKTFELVGAVKQKK